MRVLEGKNVLLTGANRGIGLVTLKEMARKGADIWACARTYSQEFEIEIQRLMDENNVKITPVYFDLRNEEEVKRAVSDILKEKRTIDVLVNNAGVPYGATMQMTSIKDLKDVYEINFFAQIYLTQLVSKSMIRQKKGVIINLASVGGIEATEGYLAYGSSKAALIYATKVMAKELGKYGICVNAIAPGLVDTRMGHFKTEKELEKVLDRTALGRMAFPEEIADAIVYMASEQASYVTGHVLVIDGGRTL